MRFYFTIYVSEFVISSYFCEFNGSNLCIIGCDNFVNVFLKLVGGGFGEFLKFYLVVEAILNFLCSVLFNII